MNQRPHWACWHHGHSGIPVGDCVAERWLLLVISKVFLMWFWISVYFPQILHCVVCRTKAQIQSSDCGHRKTLVRLLSDDFRKTRLMNDQVTPVPLKCTPNLYIPNTINTDFLSDLLFTLPHTLSCMGLSLFWPKKVHLEAKIYLFHYCSDGPICRKTKRCKIHLSFYSTHEIYNFSAHLLRELK